MYKVCACIGNWLILFEWKCFSCFLKDKVMEWKTNEFLSNCWNIRFIQMYISRISHPYTDYTHQRFVCYFNINFKWIKNEWILVHYRFDEVYQFIIYVTSLVTCLRQIGLNLTCQIVCSVLNAHSHMIYPNLIRAAMVYPLQLFKNSGCASSLTFCIFIILFSC